MPGGWIRRLASALLVTFVATGCTANTASPGPTPLPSATSDNVIDFVGLPEALIGAPMEELVSDGVASTTGPGCGASFPSTPHATPVFGDGKLVLIWAYPPLHTPENVTVGTPVDTTRNAYPGAMDLTPAAGSQRYPGILVTGPDDLVYLFLHDGKTVQKVIIGLDRYARMLFDTGFGSC